MAAAKSIANVVSKSYPAVPGGLSTAWVTGKKHQLPEVKENVGEIGRKWKLFLYRQDEYCKVGLLRHDRINPDHFKMDERVKARMTQEQLNAMNYRLSRALLLSALKRNLPEDEWTPMDAEHLYLSDIYEQLESEQFEQKLTKIALNDYDDNLERIKLLPFFLRHYFKVMATRKEMAMKFSQSAV